MRTDKNEALKAPKEVELTGDERYFIEHCITKIKESDRTMTEIRLLKKVR